MRFGLGAKIVALIVCVLALTFVAIGTASQHFESRLVTPSAGSPPAAPDLMPLAKWYRSRHSWSGVEQTLARISVPPYGLIIVAKRRVAASSVPQLTGAAVEMNGPGGIQIILKRAPGNAANQRIRLTGASSKPIVESGAVAGEVYVIPGPSLSPMLIHGASDALARGRFLWLFALISAAAILVALLLSAYIVTPVRALTRALSRASAAVVPCVAVTSRDELGDLARAFNALGDRLMRSEAARRAVISDVAHELRTPLTNIRCALEALEDGIDEPSPEALSAVLSDVLLLQRLVTDLHDLSVTDSAAIVLECIPTELERETRSAVAAFRERALERNVRIEICVEGFVPRVACDPPRIRQVLHNLLENALRYGRPGGRLLVSISNDASAVRLAVTDDGDGIPAEEEMMIFERLYRRDPSRSRSTGGRGLGLAIAKQLVEKHGGQIGANGGLGIGATVWFTLPPEGSPVVS